MKFKRNGSTGDYESDCNQYKIVKYYKTSTEYMYIACTCKDLVYLGAFDSLKNAQQFLTSYTKHFDECAKYIWNRSK